MKSSLKQHISSAVNDLIPLGPPRRHSADDTCRAQQYPRQLSLETNKKHVHTPSPLNPPSKRMLSHKSAVPEQRGTPAVALPVGSKKFCVSGQEKPSSYHFSKDGSCHPAAKTDAVSQRDSSYHKQREFAFSFCKQLTENLKVEKPVSQSRKFHRQTLPAVQISSSVSKSCSLSAPQNSQIVHRSPVRSVVQQHHQSAENMDKLLSGNHKLPLLGPDSTIMGDLKLCHAATPGSRSLSLKRRRENSAERTGEGKILCQEDSRLAPISVSDSSSSGSSVISSPPKYIKRAFLKSGNDSVLTINEKRSPVSNLHSEDRIRHSDHVAKQLFKEASHKLHAGTQPSTDLETSNLRKDMGMFSQNKSHLSNTLHSHTCTSPSNNQKHCDGGSSASSRSSSSSGLMDNLPSKQTKPTSSSCQGSTGSWIGDTDEKKIPKPDPKLNPTVKQEGKEKKAIVWKDPLDLELEEDVGLSLRDCALSLSSSHSSDEEEHLLSLKEILQRSVPVPMTPEKMAFSEPSTPVPKVATEDLQNKPVSYKNTLEQMLKEKEQNQKSKELEIQLLQACKDDLLKLDEEDENAEAALSHEQKEFLQKFSVTSCAIRDIHPGEEVFMLGNFGRLFSHRSLDLRKLDVCPNNRAQQTLLQANSEQFLLLLSAGLLRRAYSSSPCQPQVTRWLFQMMSVHPNPIICTQLLQAMMTVALAAAQQIVEKRNKKFEVWVPSIRDVALVFLNMGVSFVSLFPLEALQPSFNEGDLLESLEIQPDGKRNEKKPNTFPQHNFESIIKYLALCAALCPRVYTDEELLLLSTVVCRVSLETHLQFLPTADLCCLLQHLLRNMTEWETQLPQLCQAIADLSEDHHNLRRLVQLLPHSGRGKQLRRHLSVSIISKLLNQRCTYKPSCTEFKLSDLRCYLPRMRPSLLLKGFVAAKVSEAQETDDCVTTPDQQAYYLCYSLLALTNEASNFEFLPSKQRNELLLLSAELEKHIKCDIRESEKMLYRSKVKDFVARIYTKWQVLLQRSRPQEGKLYDYWKPLPEDEMPANKESESSEQSKPATTEAPQGEHSDSSLSEEEEEVGVEKKDEVTVESEEELDSAAGEIQEKNEELEEVLGEKKENEAVVNMDYEAAKEDVEYDLDDELLAGSSEESDTDEDLIKREEELLKDEDSVDGDGGLVAEGGGEPEKLEGVANGADVFGNDEHEST